MKDKDYEQLATKIMMNALEGVKAQIRKAYDKGYKDGKADTPFTDTEEAENKAYNRGLNTAWELVKRIESTPEDGGLTNQQIEDVFGQYWSSYELYKSFSVDEAMGLMKRYEDKRKQDAEIKVGDEVRGIDSGKRAVILDKKYGLYRALAFDGIIHEGTEEAFTKTGRTFPEIAEVLKEMRGADE